MSEQHTLQIQLSGEVVGRHYQLEDKVGQGGMAWVYRAKHQLLGGNVAIKILFPQFADDEKVRKRFLREARIQYQLEHPHIVRVIDFVDERGFVGYVSEWCNGGDLLEWLESWHARPLKLGEIRSLFMPLLEAIQLAHTNNVVHRDLKPQNIMLHKRGEILTPKLTDFGVAKTVAEQGLTSTGMVVGTVYYMSPEQLYESKSVDHRSDIYSLGVILYQLASGSLPFVGEAPSIFMKILQETPKDISAIPEQLNAIIQRCLAKDPIDRFSSCMELQEELHQVLEPPIPILPPGEEVSRTAEQQARIGLASAVLSFEDVSKSNLIRRHDPFEETAAFEPTQVLSTPEDEPENPTSPTPKSSGRKTMFGLMLLLFFGVVAGGYGWYQTQGLWWKESPPDASGGTLNKVGVLQPRSRKPKVPSKEKPQSRDAGSLPEVQPPAPEKPSLQPDKNKVRRRRVRRRRARRRRARRRRVRRRGKGGLAKQCKRGRGSACYKLGMLELKKKYWAIDYRLARQLFRQACLKRIRQGCYQFGVLLSSGKGGARNRIEAYRVFRRACRLRDALSCRSLGYLYQQGRGFWHKPRMARTYYKKACRYKDAVGCTLLGVLYRMGLGGKKSHRKAFQLYRKACFQMKHNVGCFNLGMMYYRGWGTPKKLALSHRFFAKACKAKMGQSCYFSARTLWALKGRKACRQIDRLFRQGCAYRFRQACYEKCSNYILRNRRQIRRGDNFLLDGFR